MSHHPTARRRHAARSRTWRDLQLDLLGDDRSDAPRLPVHQVHHLHGGALTIDQARAWSLLTHPVDPARRWPLFVFGAGNLLAAVTALVVAWPVEALLAVLHLLDLAQLDGAGGRIATALSFGLLSLRPLIRLARWGVQRVGE